jgi:HPt (histidine-containing phosphotransfer) domain-containing protein
MVIAQPQTMRTAEDQVLNPSTLVELQMLGEGMFEEIVSAFVADIPGRLARLHSLCATRAADAITREAHGLKGGALSVGAAHLADICAAIESYAGVGQVEQAAALEDSLEPAFNEARHALEELCRCPPTA